MKKNESTPPPPPLGSEDPKGKEEGKDQELIQSSTTLDPGHHTGK